MKKLITLGLAFTFIVASITPFVLASRDRYHTLKAIKGDERRYSRRIAPFDTKTYKNRNRITQYTKRYQRYVKPQVTRAIRDELVDIRSENIPFYISLPKGFRREIDNLQWDGGIMKYKKDDAVVEIEATQYRCDGGNTYKYHCLEEGTKDITAELMKKYPRMEKTEKKLISLHASSLIQPQKFYSSWYIVFANSDEKIVQLTFLEPTHQFLWRIQMRSDNVPNSFLSNDRSVQKVIASLFRRPSLTHLGGRRFSTSYKHVKRNKKATQRSQYQAPKMVKNENKMLADFVAFDLKVPKGFYKADDSLELNSGDMLIRDRYGSTIQIIATSNKCIGDPQSKNSSERKNLRICIENESKNFVSKFLADAESYNVLHDENFAIDLTFNNKIHKETGRYFMVDSEKERKVFFTFREPSNGYMWTLEMTAPKGKRNFLTNTQEIKRVISSLFFHAGN